MVLIKNIQAYLEAQEGNLMIVEPGLQFRFLFV